MKLSIIIPVWNRKDNIARVLTCLFRQEIQPQHTVKIILVDDGSDDGLFANVATHAYPQPFTYIHRPREHNWNASKPRNMGARAADTDTDCYYFLDSDVLLPPNRIQRLIDVYEMLPSPSRVVIGPYNYLQNPIDVSNEKWYEQPITDYQQDVRWQSFLDNPVAGLHNGISFALACFGGSLLVPRNLFYKAGCYNEKIGAGCEDGEFGLRLARSGAQFSLDRELLAWHHPHPILPARTEGIRDYVKMINLDHFGSENPDYGLIEASKETYEKWGINWKPPDVWK